MNIKELRIDKNNKMLRIILGSCSLAIAIIIFFIQRPKILSIAPNQAYPLTIYSIFGLISLFIGFALYIFFRKGKGKKFRFFYIATNLKDFREIILNGLFFLGIGLKVILY